MGQLEVNQEGKERLDRFFIKLLSEVQAASADHVTFEIENESLTITIGKSAAPIRQSNSRITWFSPIRDWLWQHVSPTWNAQNPSVFMVPEKFRCLVQLEPRPIEFHVFYRSDGSDGGSIILSSFTDRVTVCSMDKVEMKGSADSTEVIEVTDDFFMSEAEIIHEKLGIKRQRPLILLVEDDPDQRSIIKMVLTEANYDIAVASDGEEAQKFLVREIPDLIITDVMMPNIDGPELVRRIKADSRLKSIPLLVLTVLGDAEKEYSLLSLGVDDYCEKTMQRKILLKRIENLLKRSKVNQLKDG